MSDNGVSVIIPAYNEEQGLPPTLRALREQLAAYGGEHEIIVIDDASTDKTREAAELGGAKVYTNAANMGYGFSLKTGLHLAKYENIFIVDADNSYDLSNLAVHLHAMEFWDMVVGVRGGLKQLDGYFKGFFRWLIITLLEFISGSKIPDMNSGYRIFKKKLFQRYRFILPNGFSFSTSMTLLCIMNWHTIRYETIQYTARVGKTKVKKVRDAMRLLQFAFEIVVFNNPTKIALLVILFNAALLAFYGALELVCDLGQGFLVFLLVTLTSEIVFMLGAAVANQKNWRRQQFMD